MDQDFQQVIQENNINGVMESMKKAIFNSQEPSLIYSNFDS